MTQMALLKRLRPVTRFSTRKSCTQSAPRSLARHHERHLPKHLLKHLPRTWRHQNTIDAEWSTSPSAVAMTTTWRICRRARTVSIRTRCIDSVRWCLCFTKSMQDSVFTPKLLLFWTDRLFVCCQSTFNVPALRQSPEQLHVNKLKTVTLYARILNVLSTYIMKWKLVMYKISSLHLNAHMLNYVNVWWIYVSKCKIKLCVYTVMCQIFVIITVHVHCTVLWLGI